MDVKPSLDNIHVKLDFWVSLVLGFMKERLVYECQTNAFCGEIFSVEDAQSGRTELR